MAINKVDYDVLENGKAVYANQAAALDDIIQTLNSMNAELQASWTNKTADAFIARYESEHRLALEKAADALQSISDFIQQYSAGRQEDDDLTASSISG